MACAVAKGHVTFVKLCDRHFSVSVPAFRIDHCTGSNVALFPFGLLWMAWNKEYKSFRRCPHSPWPAKAGVNMQKADAMTWLVDKQGGEK